MSTMDPPRPHSLFVTFVEKEGPFLKVWGQTDKAMALHVQQLLFNVTPQFESGLYVPHAEVIQVGFLCCAKYRDNKFYRARVINLNFVHNRYVEVVFIDYGHRDFVPTTHLRSLDIFNSSFIAIRPQATGFLLAEAVCTHGEWNDKIVEEISKQIIFSEGTFTPIAQVAKQFLIRLFIGRNDLGVHLISRGLMRHTTLTTQEAVLLSTMATQQLPPPTQNIATYKTFSLEPGAVYPVYVSYITDGPCNFSVQLKQTEEALGKLMKEINSMNLTPLEDIPIPGTVCLARCAEDGHICRAVVTNEVDGNFKVFYVDFGNFEVVTLEALYEIPFKNVIPKAMAIRYSLYGVEKATVTLEMLCAFKNFVDNRLINMTVVPSSTRLALPKCELCDPETNLSALDVINQAATAAYPEHVALNRGFTQPVKISYVRGCNKFYAQFRAKEDELSRLMGEIQQTCTRGDPINPQQLKVNLPCYALYAGDAQWYRGQIIEILPDGFVKIHYVDYGNEEIVQASALKPIEGKHLTVLRPQAIECCFNGYQNMDADAERDNLLEELILDGNFTMKVVEMQGSKALVELYDASNYNVASLLLDKIATKRSQVSPMLLVQAGNKIEHRKSQKPERENKPWQNGTSENATPSSSWRQDNQGGQSRKNEFETNNESDNKNWRQNQNNKPPRGNFDRNRSEPDANKDTIGNEGPRNQNRNVNNRNRNDVDNRNARATDTWNQNKTDGDWKQDRGGFNRNSKERDGKENTWGDTTGTGDNQNSWGASNKDDRKGFSPKSRDSGFKRQDREGGRDNRNGWHADSSKQGGFKKKTDFKREGSEVSSSGSEKSFNKGSKSGGFNKNSSGNKFANKPKSVVGTTEVPDAASSTEKFQVSQVVGTESDIKLSWFHNPLHFYVQLEQAQTSFTTLMTDIQQAYKDRIPSPCDVGAPIIGLFPEDGVLYRAEILEKVGNRYKVRYVDFGNISTIDKVWPIERKFMTLPAQAIRCGLASIQAPAESWPTGQSYGKYFESGSLHCKFESNDGETNYVQLENNGKNINQVLVSDGLALELPPPKVVDIPLLLGQQFRAIILSVNSLSDFSVCLQDGTLLYCSIFMISASTETFEDNLKAKIDQVVILYVDNVTDDSRLEVTVYDSSGVQVKLIDGNPDAFESVEITCPYLISQSRLFGLVSHFEDNIVYLQPEDCYDNLELLLNSIFEFYDQSVLESPIVPSENFVYAVKSSDGNWYRARVLSIEDDKVQVNFIDYGNSEHVEVASLRELTFEFMEFNVMCIPIIVTIPGEDLVRNAATFDIVFTDSGVEGTLVSAEQPEQSEIAQTLEAEQPQPIQEEQSQPIPEEQEQQLPTETVSEQVETTTYEGSLVVLSHVDSPGDFYLQLSETIPAIENLQALLQEKVMSMPDLDNPKVAALCAAPYLADQQWYRATILDGDSDITTVRFVDYGNTDVLDNKTVKVKTLPAELLTLEVHAARCRMNVKAGEDDEWTSAASDRFEQLTSVANLTAKFLHQDDKINYVELFSDGVNVADVLVGEGLAVTDDQVAPSDVATVGFVSHLNSPSEFWIQLENCVDELEWVAERLSGAEKFAELEDSSPGAMCAALFPDDLMWYRARILSNTVAGIEVLFVDYGNSCTSCSLRTLPEDLVLSAPLAQKCSLSKPEGLNNWSPSMVKKFSELSADGQTTFVINKLSTGETAIVQLQLDGVDVSTLLLPTTESVSVKSFSNLEDLVLVKDGQQLEGVFTLEPLVDLDWTEGSVAKFADLNKNGETVFQAEFVSDNVVRLYTNLDDVRLDLGGAKKQTVTSTPVKIRSDSKEVIKALVQDLVEVVSSAAEDSSTLVVEPIITDIVDNVGIDSLPQPSQSPTNEEFVQEKSPESLDTSSDSHVEAIVDNLIESAMDQSEILDSDDKSKSPVDVLVKSEISTEELQDSMLVNTSPEKLSDDAQVNISDSSSEMLNESTDESIYSSTLEDPIDNLEFKDVKEDEQQSNTIIELCDSPVATTDVSDDDPNTSNELNSVDTKGDHPSGTITDVIDISEEPEKAIVFVESIIENLIDSALPSTPKGSRPGSACSGKIPYDEKIVAASVCNVEILSESPDERGDCDNRKDVSGDSS